MMSTHTIPVDPNYRIMTPSATIPVDVELYKSLLTQALESIEANRFRLTETYQDNLKSLDSRKSKIESELMKIRNELSSNEGLGESSAHPPFEDENKASNSSDTSLKESPKIIKIKKFIEKSPLPVTVFEVGEALNMTERKDMKSVRNLLGRRNEGIEKREAYDESNRLRPLYYKKDAAESLFQEKANRLGWSLKPL